MTFCRNKQLFGFNIALIAFLLLAILPLAYMLSVFILEVIKQPAAVTSMLIDSRQLVLLGRSITIAISATAIALLLGLPAAIMLSAKDLPFKKLFFFLVLIPVLIPSYVMAGAWIHLLSPTGTINQVLVSLFGPSAKISIYSSAGCAWCLGVSFFPIISLIVATGLSKLDSNLNDIARLSTNSWGVFWHSTLPQIRAHLTASICLVMIFVLGQYGVPSLLGINTYPVEIFAQFSAFYDDSSAVATALPLMILVVLLVVIQRQVMGNLDYVRIAPDSEIQKAIKLNKSKRYAVIFLIALFFITTVLPLLSVLANTQGFMKIISALKSYGDSIVTTSLLALLAAIISAIIAFPIGRYLAISNSRFTALIDILCWLPIAVPGTIIGLGLIKLSSGVTLNDSFGLWLLFAYIGMFSAFSIRIFQASFKRADPNIYDTAALDCQHFYQHLFHIDLPIHSTAIAASLIVVFVLVLGELNATVLLIPPGKATLSVSIDNLLHYGANATASALCLIEAAVVIFAIILGLLFTTTVKRVLK